MVNILTMYLPHQGLEHDLGCFFQLLFLCSKHENGIGPRYRVPSMARRSEILFAAPKC